jgi:ribonuclease-3 family protein
MEEFFSALQGEVAFSDIEILQLSPLVLAYIGDSVFDVYIRTLLIKKEGNVSVHKLHKQSVEYVKAKAQSDIIHRITDSLSQDELDVVKRGRNAKSGIIPKNADPIEYKYATGFEELIGYLYLKKDFKRLTDILNLSANRV